MIEPVVNLPSDGLRTFYLDTMANSTPQEIPNYSEVDQNLIQETRQAYVAGRLTNDELRRVSNNLDEDWARNFLQELASNSDNAQLKLNLAQDGISLLDTSDVGAGRRFETFSAKAAYVAKRFELMMNVITMSTVSPELNLPDTYDFTQPPPDESFNNPSKRGASQVDIPTALGGTSNVVIGVAETSVDEWRQLLEEVPEETET